MSESRRVWKTFGNTGSICLDEARKRATELLAAIRRDGVPALPEDRLFEAVAAEVFSRYGQHWKPGTMKVNRNYLRSAILPSFRGRNIADIARQDVQNWFARLHATPVMADRSMPILSVIVRKAERMGMRPESSNPRRGIKRYRRKGRERFLSDEEIRHLSDRLAAHEARWPQQVTVIRLLLLAGCRKGKILTLQ